MGQRRFSITDQTAFAELTGDRNPIHVDPLAARRTPFGRPVVHGLHVVLWAMDCLAASGSIDEPWAGMRVDFAQPCLIGDDLHVEVSGRRASGLDLSVRKGAAVLAKISLLKQPGALSGSSLERTSATLPDVPLRPRSLAASALSEDGGEYRFSPAGLRAMFPGAVRILGEPAVAGLAGLSTVVGMLCPGEYSLFAAFSAVFSENRPDAILYKVVRVHESVRQLVIRVRSFGVDANVRAGARLPPVPQVSFADVRMAVPPGAFAGRRPLIVGGSRGLGEVTAKIVAAGGGRPMITYATGASDAAAIVDEITAGGGECELCPYEVHRDPADQLRDVQGAVTGLYYFATPAIFRSKASFYDQDVFEVFTSVYVAGFASLCAALAARSNEATRVFYPSSVAVDHPAEARDLLEYAAAKAAGEVVCDHLRLNSGKFHVVSKRLPRIATDQTASIIPVRAATALDTMLPIVQEVENG